MACPHGAVLSETFPPSSEKTPLLRSAVSKLPKHEGLSHGGAIKPTHYQCDYVSVDDTTDHLPVLRVIAAEPLAYAAAPLAILLQFLKPGIALGSCRHSRFHQLPVSRLRRTVVYLTAIIYGSPEDKATVCHVVNKLHSFVRGEGYSAHDLELQRWTVGTIFVANVRVIETFRGPMSRERKAALCRDMAVVGTSLKMPPEMWPNTLEAFEEYWEETLAATEVIPESREGAARFLYGMMLPWYLAWIPFFIRVFMAVWLPERLRREYGLPDPATTWWVWLVYRAVVAFVSTTYPLVPLRLRMRGHDWLMADMRRAAAGIRRTGRFLV